MLSNFEYASMKKNHSLGIVIAMTWLLTAASVQSQNASGRQFYVESGGPGLAFGMNFDSRFKGGERLGLGYRLGIGFSPKDSGEGTYFSIPVGINYIFGKENSPHTFEVGGGIALLTDKVTLGMTYGNSPPRSVFGYLSFMYRKAPVDGGFTWRIGCVPIIISSNDIGLLPAVGIGYAF